MVPHGALIVPFKHLNGIEQSNQNDLTNIESQMAVVDDPRRAHNIEMLVLKTKKELAMLKKIEQEIQGATGKDALLVWIVFPTLTHSKKEDRATKLARVEQQMQHKEELLANQTGAWFHVKPCSVLDVYSKTNDVEQKNAHANINKPNYSGTFQIHISAITGFCALDQKQNSGSKMSRNAKGTSANQVAYGIIKCKHNVNNTKI